MKTNCNKEKYDNSTLKNFFQWMEWNFIFIILLIFYKIQNYEIYKVELKFYFICYKFCNILQCYKTNSIFLFYIFIKFNYISFYK